MMFKTTFALCVLAIASGVSAQPLCPRSPDVGNYINYLHLFKEEADTLLNFYNAKTLVEAFYEDITTVGSTRHHKIAFRVTDSNYPQKTWIFAVWAKLDSNDVLLDIYNFTKFRSLPDDLGNPVVILQRPNAEYLKSFFILGALPTFLNINCSLSVIKLEYMYFYYMFANYYKNGSGLIQPSNIGA